jgi:hypothetical protein
MNQQAREKLRHLLEGTLEVQGPKVKTEAKDQEEIPDTITQSGLINGRQGHLPEKCNRKRERFPTTKVECQENEIKALLALEIPTKKKKRKKQDYGHIICFHCQEQGHFADQCPEKEHKTTTGNIIKKDLTKITCFKCKQKGHCFNACLEKSTFVTIIDLEDQED